MSEKPGVVLFWETFELLKLLDEHECKQMLLSIYEYARNNISPDFSDNRALNLVWQTAKYRLDDDARRYANVCNKRTEAGKKGAQRRWQSKAEMANAIENSKNGNRSQHNTTQHNLTQLKDKDIYLSKDSKKEKFTPPSLEEVQAYCTERGNNIDPNLFIDFYRAKGWKVGAQPMKDWRACVRTWERNGENSSRNQKADEQENPFSYLTETFSV